MRIVGAMFCPPMLNVLSIARLLNQFLLLCTLCRRSARRLTGLAILPALLRGPPNPHGPSPKYPTVNSRKAKPMWPKIRTTNFLHAGSSNGCKVRCHASDLRIRRDVDAVSNVPVRPVSTAGEHTRQPMGRRCGTSMC